MPLLKANLLHPDLSIGSDGEDAALLAAVGSCDDLDEIAFSNAVCPLDKPPARRYECVNRALQSTPSCGKKLNNSLYCGLATAPRRTLADPTSTRGAASLDPPRGDENGGILAS